MEYNTPSSYKNYLPSKKIRIIIGILIVIGLGYFTIPLIIKSVKQGVTREIPPTNLVISTPTGDPTTRDTDGDGVPDWQEIAMGLDPAKPQTNLGVSDMTTFQNIKNAVGNNTFDLEAGKVTDTDKVSLTIYDALASDSRKNNGVSVGGTQSITQQELFNYIEARKKSITVYTEKDITSVESSLESNKAYAERMKKIIAETPETKEAPKKIQGYLDGTVPLSSISPLINLLQKRSSELRAMQVPKPVVSTHVEILNATQTLYELLSLYTPQEDDPASQMSTLALVQDSFIQASKNIGYLSMYLSVALNKNGYLY
jgi:hypothetical protein